VNDFTWTLDGKLQLLFVRALVCPRKRALTTRSTTQAHRSRATTNARCTRARMQQRLLTTRTHCLSCTITRGRRQRRRFVASARMHTRSFAPPSHAPPTHTTRALCSRHDSRGSELARNAENRRAENERRGRHRTSVRRSLKARPN